MVQATEGKKGFKVKDIIARLRATQPENDDVMVICDELEARLIEESNPKPIVQQQSNPRTEYQRQYMRDMRAAKKLGLTTAEYRAKSICEPLEAYLRQGEEP
jgi:hypothetical protein